MKWVRNRIVGGIFLIIVVSVMFAIYREFRLFYGFGFMGLFSLIIFGAVAITFITSIVQGIKGNQQHNPLKTAIITLIIITAAMTTPKPITNLNNTMYIEDIITDALCATAKQNPTKNFASIAAIN